VRLALAMVEAEIAREAEHAEPSRKATVARKRAEKRARDIRCDLARTGEREAVAQLNAALASGGGALVRTCARAHVDMREHLVRAAVDFAHVAREHAVDSTSALATLGRSARWSALADAVLERLARDGLDGERVDALAKLATSATSSARLDLLGALELQRQATDHARQPRGFVWPTAAPAPQDSGRPSSPAEGDAVDASSPEVPPSEEPPSSSVSWADGGTDGTPNDDHGSGDDDEGFGGFNPRPDIAPVDPYVDQAARAYRDSLRAAGFPLPKERTRP
jgi:hypothetical protein